jgi:hypothetical protein
MGCGWLMYLDQEADRFERRLIDLSNKRPLLAAEDDADDNTDVGALQVTRRLARRQGNARFADSTGQPETSCASLRHRLFQNINNFSVSRHAATEVLQLRPDGIGGWLSAYPGDGRRGSVRGRVMLRSWAMGDPGRAHDAGGSLARSTTSRTQLPMYVTDDPLV